jgi:hypothetical protein
MSLLGDQNALEAHLDTMIQAIATKLAEEYSERSLSTGVTRVSAHYLLLHLAYGITKRKRHAITPIVPENLKFELLKTRNPDESAFDEHGVKTKGEKRWYYLILTETAGGVGSGGDVEILVEGGITLEKGKALEEFRSKVELQAEEWEKEWKEKKRARRRLRVERDGRQVELGS